MKVENKKKGIVRLLEIAGRKKGMLFLSGFCALIHALMSLIPYVLVFYIIVQLTEPSADFNLIRSYLGYAFFAVILSMIIFFFSGILSHIAAYNILFELRKYIAEKVGELPMGYLGNQNSGALKKVLADDVERIENFIAHQIPDFIRGVALPVITVVYLFGQDWRLAAVSGVPLLVLAILMPVMYGGRNKILIQEYHRSLAEMNAGIVEYVRAMPVMKIFGQSADTFSGYGKKVKSFHEMLQIWIRSSTPPFAIFMSFTSNALLPVLALGLYLFFNNGLTLPVLLLFLILGTGYIKPLFALSNMGMQLSVINRGVEQIDELLNAEPLYNFIWNQQMNDYAVKFDRVNFSYHSSQKVLNDVSFEVKPNTVTALVGPSGAGKSTVGQLLARFWDVDEGQITIGGIEIKMIPIEQLMEKISFVFQESFMFQESIYENIRMGMDKTRTQVEEAAKAAQLHDLIVKLPNGYDTLFGQNGIHLSGGEQQRFQLARAILKDAPVLILDEATSFADPENEYKIQQAFSTLIKNKTVIVIAHRLSTIVDADQIIVFDQGTIVGVGKHEALLAGTPLYKRMWQAHTRARDFVMKQEYHELINFI